MAVTQSPKADFYVATNGDDAWSGKLAAPNAAKTDGPFATLARARDAVRELKKEGAKKDIVVLVRGGTYYLKDTVVFGLEDSAAEGRGAHDHLCGISGRGTRLQLRRQDRGLERAWQGQTRGPIREG